MSKVVSISVNYERLNTQVGFKIVSDNKIELQVTEPVEHTCGKRLVTLDDVFKHLKLEEQDHSRFNSLFEGENKEGNKFTVKSGKIECHSFHFSNRN